MQHAERLVVNKETESVEKVENRGAAAAKSTLQVPGSVYIPARRATGTICSSARQERLITKKKLNC